MKISSMLEKVKVLLIALLIVSLFIIATLVKISEKEPRVIIDTDTITLVDYDTITIIEPYVVSKTTIDTFKYKVSDTMFIEMPIVQKYYNNDTLYNVWVSGIEPLSLDSIEVFRKETTNIITNNVIVEDNTKHLYLGAGVSYMNGVVIPSVSASLNVHKKALIGAFASTNAEQYNFGINLQYKIK